MASVALGRPDMVIGLGTQHSMHWTLMNVDPLGIVGQTGPVALTDLAPASGQLDAGPDHLRAVAIGKGALALTGMGAALLAARAVSIHAPACPFRSLTGIPCPGCGMTRLADTVAQGQVADAIRADAAGVAILVIMAVLAVTYLVRVVLRTGHPPAWMRSRLLPAALGGLVAIHWLTTLITGGITSS